MASRKNSTNETAILSSIQAYLKEAGLFYWRSNNIPALGRQGFRYHPNTRGLPDIFVVCRGRIVALEVKRPEGAADEREPNGRRVRGGKMSPYQMEWASRFQKEGGHFYVVCSVEDAIQALSNFIGAPPLTNHPSV